MTPSPNAPAADAEREAMERDYEVQNWTVLALAAKGEEEAIGAIQRCWKYIQALTTRAERAEAEIARLRTFPKPAAGNDTWTICPDYLTKFQDLVEVSGWGYVELEQIQAILLARAALSNEPQAAADGGGGVSAHVCDHPACSVAGAGHPLACGCRSASSPPDAPSALDAMLATAHTKAAEAMREAAAQECDRHAAWLKKEAHAGGDWKHLIARAVEATYNAQRIRALSTPTAPGGEAK